MQSCKMPGAVSFMFDSFLFFLFIDTGLDRKKRTACVCRLDYEYVCMYFQYTKRHALNNGSSIHCALVRMRATGEQPRERYNAALETFICGVLMRSEG